MDGRTSGSNVSSVINLIAGIWLVLSAFIFGTGVSSIGFVVGIVVAVLALIRLSTSAATVWLSWINAILGLWLLFTPMLYSDMSVSLIWNSVILGIVIIAMSIWDATSSTMGHGHPKMG